MSQLDDEDIVDLFDDLDDLKHSLAEINETLKKIQKFLEASERRRYPCGAV